MSPEFGWVDALTCKVFSPGQRRLLLGSNFGSSRGIRIPVPRQIVRPFLRVWNRVPCHIDGHSATGNEDQRGCLFCGAKP